MMTSSNFRTVFAVLGISFLSNGLNAAEKLDPRTLCPSDGSMGQTILLIDTTDPLPPATQTRLKQLLQGFGDSQNSLYLPRSHELIVYHLTSSISKMSKRKPLRVCNPGNPEERGIIDNLISSPAEAKRNWRKFELLRKRAYLRIKEQTEEEQSPLLESLALVSAANIPILGVEEQRKPTRLILFSDMLQNSKNLSHYQSLPTMKVFKSLVGFSDMKSALRGADVLLVYVRRTGLEHKQTPRHYYWWTQAIELFGGHLIEQLSP